MPITPYPMNFRRRRREAGSCSASTAWRGVVDVMPPASAPRRTAREASASIHLGEPPPGPPEGQPGEEQGRCAVQTRLGPLERPEVRDRLDHQPLLVALGVEPGEAAVERVRRRGFRPECPETRGRRPGGPGMQSANHVGKPVTAPEESIVWFSITQSLGSEARASNSPRRCPHATRPVIVSIEISVFWIPAESGGAAPGRGPRPGRRRRPRASAPSPGGSAAAAPRG